MAWPATRPLALFASRNALPIVVVAIVGIPFALRLELLEVRGFNPDEFQHLHHAWRISLGDLPSRDFFDHHLPALHFLLAPLLRGYQVAWSGSEAIAAILQARRLMWVCAAGVLLGSWMLAAAWRGRREAWTVVALLSGLGLFLSKSVEVRPDVPAAALLVAAVLAWLRALRGGRWSMAVASGLLLGLALVFTQKVLFFGPGLACVSVLYVVEAGAGGTRRRIGLVLVQVACFLLPLAATCLYFAFQDSLVPFLDANFVKNATWSGPGPSGFLAVIAREDTAFIVLLTAGLVVGSRGAAADPGGRAAGWLVPACFLSPALGLSLLPVVTFHYFLLLAPFAACLAAAGLLAVLDHAGPSGRRWLPLALALLAIVPMRRFVDAFERGNWSTLEGLRFVARNTAPWEPVLDGFTGLGVFRPRPFFHAFLSEEFFAVQTPTEREAVLAAFRTGRVAPKLVLLTHYLEDGVTPATLRFLQQHYVASGLDPIYLRPFDLDQGWWNDVAPRHFGWTRDAERRPHMYFLEGWRDVEERAPHSRTSRTARSRLLVPVRHPRDSDLLLLARLEGEVGSSCSLELVVNGHSAGVAPLGAAWRELRFAAPQRIQIQGFNLVELRYLGANGDRCGSDVTFDTLTVHKD